MGSTIARLAVLRGVVEEVVCMDRDLDRARLFLDFDEARDLPLERVDALDAKALTSKLQGFDFVVNALPTFTRFGRREVPLNPIAMEAALKAGSNYVDLACYGGRRTSAEQLALSRQFSNAGLLAAINFGASPGLSNVLVKEACEDLDRVESVTFISIEDQRGSTFIIPWSREELLRTAVLALSYRGGKYSWVEPFEESKVLDFPEPIGSVRCYNVPNDESYTIPKFIRLRSLHYYAGGSDIEALRALYRLGIFSGQPVRVGRALVSPRELLYHILPTSPLPRDVLTSVREGELEDAYFALQAMAEGEAGGEAAEARRLVIFPSQRRVNELLPGATYITYPTALCTIALLRALRGRKLRGVMPSEALPRYVRRALLEALERERIIVNEEFKLKSLAA